MFKAKNGDGMGFKIAVERKLGRKSPLSGARSKNNGKLFLGQNLTNWISSDVRGNIAEIVMKWQRAARNMLTSEWYPSAKQTGDVEKPEENMTACGGRIKGLLGSTILVFTRSKREKS